MPVELSERALRDALAVLGEHGDGAMHAEAALGWMGWEQEGPLLLRRYDVQQFVWYVLPRKFLAPLDDKREAAAALARLLECLGGRAATYADACRGTETDELLCAWEAEEPSAFPRFRKLLDGSGIEPPDTELLTWGQIMGLDEACVRERVSIALEEAVEDGRLAPGATGWRRHRAQIADAALLERWDDDGDATCLDAVHAERLERWLERGPRRGTERSAIVASAAATLAADPPAVDPQAAGTAVAAVRWLLDRAEDGIALTQTGALNRALVRALVEQWPGWWDADIYGLPNREDDVALLHELHARLRGSRLIRRSGRSIVLTKRGRELRDDPAALLTRLATDLLAGESFTAACAELASVLILAGVPAHDTSALAERMHPALVERGWRSEDGAIPRRAVTWTLADVLRAAEAIGILGRAPGGRRDTRETLALTEPGRAAMIGGLRARALAPGVGPY